MFVLFQNDIVVLMHLSICDLFVYKKNELKIIFIHKFL
jgi:hypothetical protein